MIEVAGRQFRLHVCDAIGSNRNWCSPRTLYRGANGVVLVYDVGRRSSFENVRLWAEEVRKTAAEAAFVLVSNKCDLKHREVSVEEGQTLAEQLNCKFVEASAQTGSNVEEVFRVLVSDVRAGVVRKAEEAPTTQ